MPRSQDEQHRLADTKLGDKKHLPRRHKESSRKLSKLHKPSRSVRERPVFRQMAPSQDILLLVDVQVGFDHPTYWGTRRSNPSFEANIVTLLDAFRKAARQHPDLPTHGVVHVTHSSTEPCSPLHPSSDGHAIQPYAKPINGEPVIVKHVNSGFIGTELEALLKKKLVRRLVIAGLTTDHCVSTTTRMAANLFVTSHLNEKREIDEGSVILVEDATATWDRDGFDAETIHKVNIASLRGEFCEIMNTGQVLKMLSFGAQEDEIMTGADDMMS